MLKSFSDFTAYCRTLSGKTLETGARGKPFTVSVEANAVYFIPKSSGKPRRADAEKDRTRSRRVGWVERVDFWGLSLNDVPRLLYPVSGEALA
jgi:hypothetical protein